MTTRPRHRGCDIVETVNYLLEDTPLFGGVKVVLRQADLLHRAGVRTRLVSPGSRPDWCGLEAEFLQVPNLEPGSVPPADLQVATYWTTIDAAVRADGQALHYCQGFEASYTHNVADHPRIEQAYRHHIPAMVVSPHLGDLLASRFGRPARVVPQPLETFFRPEPERTGAKSPPRVLLMSPFEIDWKGVSTGLKAISILRRHLGSLELVRVSQWPQTDEERATFPADEFYCHLQPSVVAEVLRSCDLLLAPSWEQEGFGLPVLEAMASGVPVVASDIASYRGFAGQAATLVPWDRPDRFAAAALELLSDPELWLSRRRLGLTTAASYSPEAAQRTTCEVMEWAASGAWKEQHSPTRPKGYRP